MCISIGERRRKVVCVRKSDHLEVSDQRCEHLPHPVALTEPCNTDCEARCALTHKTHCTPTTSIPTSIKSQTFLASSNTGGMLLERVNVLLNVVQATAAWMFSV